MQVSDEIDWDKGIIDLLPQVAGGRSAMKAMRGVSHSWQSGFERSVKTLRIREADPVPERGELLAERFPGLTSLDLCLTFWRAEELLDNLRSFPKLRNLVLEDSEFYSPDYYDLRLLQGMPIASLDLSRCSSLTDAGLEALRGLPLTRLFLDSCTNCSSCFSFPKLTASGLSSLRGMPLTWLNLTDFSNLSSRAAFEELQGLPLTFLSLRTYFYWQLGNPQGAYKLLCTEDWKLPLTQQHLHISNLCGTSELYIYFSNNKTRHN